MFEKKAIQYPGSKKHSWNEIPLGVTLYREVVWDVSKAPHALISGSTGGGKSVAQRTIIAHCLQHSDDWEVVGIDLKQVELSEYKDYDAVTKIASTLESAVEVLQYLYDNMMERYTEMESEGINHFKDLPQPHKAIMLIVDEAYYLMASSGRKTIEAERDNALRGTATHLVEQLTRLGRASGIHVVLSTQRPDAKVISGELKQNVALRYGAGRMDTVASVMLLDSDAGTHTPSEPRGSAAISVYGEVKRIRGYATTPKWIENWYRKNQK